jgi:hypothetical protein
MSMISKRNRQLEAGGKVQTGPEIYIRAHPVRADGPRTTGDSSQGIIIIPRKFIALF